VERAPALVPMAIQAPIGMVDTDSHQERKWAAQPPVVLRLIVQAAPEPIADNAAVPCREGTPVQPEATTPFLDHSLCSTTTQRHSSEEAHDNMLGLAALEQLLGSPPSGPASRQLQEQQIEEVRALQTALSQSEAVFIEVESQLRAAAKKGGRLELGLAAAEERLRQAQAAAAGAEAVQETLQQQLLTEHDKVAELEAELAANNAPVQLVIWYTSSHPDLRFSGDECFVCGAPVEKVWDLQSAMQWLGMIYCLSCLFAGARSRLGRQRLWLCRPRQELSRPCLLVRQERLHARNRKGTGLRSRPLSFV
jgi:hypothetical protein